jgi:hypothetical protein
MKVCVVERADGMLVQNWQHVVTGELRACIVMGEQDAHRTATDQWRQ